MREKIKNLLSAEDNVSKHVIEIFKNVYFHINTDERKILIIGNPTALYIFKENIEGMKDIIIKAIEKKYGKGYEISTAPSFSDTIPEQPERVINGEFMPPVILGKKVQLNENFVFDTFQVSSCNETAYRTAIEISQPHSQLFANGNKLLYIYADFGTGKTHCSQAIAWEMLKHGMKVSYFTSDSFTEYIIDAVVKGPAYRVKRMQTIFNADAFILDDVHLLKNRKRVQEELKNIIDYFFSSRKILIFTSLYPQQKMKGFTGEVTSRMQDGQTVSIGTPDYGLKQKLLQSFIAKQNIALDNTVANALLSIEVRNVREFLGILNLIHNLYATNKKLTLKIVRENLERRGIHIPAIEEAKVMKYVRYWYGSNISFNDLKGKPKDKEMRKIRNSVIRQLITERIFTQADVARIFKISRQLVYAIMKNK